jgi:hypothetical protein
MMERALENTVKDMPEMFAEKMSSGKTRSMKKAT